jgi:NAD(P)H dehydrogenase (quinone)
MVISVILAHPDKDSFNHAIASQVVTVLKQNGYMTCFHDLYEEGFDPVLPFEEIPAQGPLPPDIQKHCIEISEADGIIVIHPNWWGQPPGILKGWVDRVIRPGVAYEFLEDDKGEGIPNGLLKAETAIVFNTSNTDIERELRVFGDPLETIWSNCIFGLCGINTFHRKMFSMVVVSSDAQRKVWLKEVARTIDDFFPNRKDI